MRIVKKILGKNKGAWDSKLRLALWVNEITIKKATSKSPFELVYGTQVRMSMNNLLPMHKFMIKEGLDIPEPMEERIEQLAELDEVRDESQNQNIKEQQKAKYL